jgi:Co/Zn/Cd efflux system component
VADAFTSLLALGALMAGRSWDLPFLDPLVAVLGSLVIGRWALGLSRQAADQLLDVTPSEDAQQAIRSSLESLGAQVLDLHLWDMGPSHRGCIVAIVAPEPLSVVEYKKAVLAASKVHHLTVEVHPRQNAA